MLDVARASGVSPATVSRALRDDPRITEEVRQRVKSAAACLGYVPNPLVQALMSQRRRRTQPHEETLALVTQEPESAWKSKDVCRWYFRGIQERAEQLGFRVEVFSLEAMRHNPARLFRVLQTQGICGVILGFAREDAPITGQDLAPFSVVGLSTYFGTLPVDRAHLNGFYNVKLAIREMRAAGYKRPALVAPVRNNMVVGGQWSAAALDEQRQRQPAEKCPPFMVEGPMMNVSHFRDWFERHRPDAILAYKERVTELLDRLRVRVPQDVGVAHLFGTEQERNSMAGIDGNLDRVGAAAVDLLVQKLHTNERGIPSHPRDVMIQGTWKDGPTIRHSAVPAEKPRPQKAAAHPASAR